MYASQRASTRVFNSVRSMLLGGLLLTGCSMPKSMEVTTGGEPIFEDKYVRFRTTYYFRVFDVCEELSGDGGIVAADWSQIFPDRRRKKLRLLKDSIYRFRMTGQADSLTNKVRFEAGTLKAHQIDPFGAGVAFDKTNNRFYLKSQEAVEEEGRRDEAFQRLRRYAAFLKEIQASGISLDEDLIAVMRDEIRALGPTPLKIAPKELVTIAFDNANESREAALKATNFAKESLETSAKAIAKLEDTADPKTFGIQELVAVGESLKVLPPELAKEKQDHSDASRDYLAGALALAIKNEAAAREAVDKARKAVEAAQAAAKAREIQTAKQRISKNVSQADTPEQSPQGKAQQEADQLIRESSDHLSRVIGYHNAARNNVRSLLVAQMHSFDLNPRDSTALREQDDCPSGSVRRRGFQVLGPEGVRTFNQDERLLMAMSSDGSPIISVLQEISARVLDQKVNQLDQLTPLAEERARVTKANRILSAVQIEAEASHSSAIAELLEALEAPKLDPTDKKEALR